MKLVLHLLLPAYLSWHINPDTDTGNPWEGHNMEDYHQMTKFMPDILPLIMAVTTGYNHIDVAKIESYGCWCVKLGSGQKRFGGKPADDFDEICKQWYRLRHCLVLEGGTCQNTKALDNYWVEIPRDASGVTNTLSNEVDTHCFPMSQYPDEDQKNCILNVCRVDYIHAKMLLEKYDEMDIGSRPAATCESGDRENDNDRRHNTCEVTDVYPFVKLIREDDNDNRDKREIDTLVENYRLAAIYGNQK